MNNLPKRSNILGVGISEVTSETALEYFFEAASEPKFSGYVTVTGVHGVMESQVDPELLDIHNNSFISTPDGIPMVWCSKWQGFKNIEQTCGPSFMPKVVSEGINSNKRHFLWGGGDGVVDILKDKLEERHPGVNIVGAVTPPFRPLDEEEERELLRQIQQTRPHFFWVGLSTPKQERFMASFLGKYRKELMFEHQGFLMFGVGAAFDFQAGIVQECPSWLRGSGFEWFYRMCKNPKRLAGRYLKNNPRFIVKIIAQQAGWTRY